MQERYEWDPAEAAANRHAHGVAFEEAIKVFRDPFAVERIDEREDCGEERVNVLGFCDGILLHATYTERDEAFRIISARRAERHEKEHYFREDSH